MDGVAQQVAALARMGMRALKERYRAVFAEEPRSGNAAWLRKRIAWRLQSLAEGDLSQRARQRADELANDADLRLSPPKDAVPVVAGSTPTTRATRTSTPTQAATPATTTPRLAVLHVEDAQPVVQQPSDDRLPPAGTVLTRAYKGTTHKVTVLADGFEYQGEKYASLSAVAKSITGQHMNGFSFFGLTRKGGKR